MRPDAHNDDDTATWEHGSADPAKDQGCQSVYATVVTAVAARSHSATRAARSVHLASIVLFFGPFRSDPFRSVPFRAAYVVQCASRLFLEQSMIDVY